MTLLAFLFLNHALHILENEMPSLGHLWNFAAGTVYRVDAIYYLP